MIPNWILKIVGWEISKKLNLQEGAMKWYQNKTLWTDVVTILVTVYGMVGAKVGPDLGFHIPAIPGIVLTVLAAVGIYHNNPV